MDKDDLFIEDNCSDCDFFDDLPFDQSEEPTDESLQMIDAEFGF